MNELENGLSPLHEERDFLLASLEDLERELAVGDIDQADYDTLKADYTTRAADVLRRIERGDWTPTAAVPASERAVRSQAIWWVAGVAAVAVVAGIFVAQFSGSRSEGDAISGDIRVTTRELLLEAQQALGEGDLDTALEIYDEVIETQPTNAEALAYKGWFLRLQGDPEGGQPFVEDAVAFAPDYADARVFAAAIALDVGDVEAAQRHLDAFDELDAAPFIQDLVIQQGLRTRLAESAQQAALERVGAVMLVSDPPPYDATGFSIDEGILAAEALAVRGDLFEGVQLMEAVVAAFPEEPESLAGYGWLLARSATADEAAPAEIGLTFLDRALGMDPDHPESLVYRTFVHNFLGDSDAAAADLARFDALSDRPPELVELIVAFGLRDLLDQ